jgi:hypothetical protein
LRKQPLGELRVTFELTQLRPVRGLRPVCPGTVEAKAVSRIQGIRFELLEASVVVHEGRCRNLAASTDKKTTWGSSVAGDTVTVPEPASTETTLAETPDSNPRYGSVISTLSPFENLGAMA